MKLASFIPFLILNLLLSACGKDDPKSIVLGSSEFRNERIDVHATTAEQCPSGGIELQTYLDFNGNSLRDVSEEVLSNNIICSGKDGENGEKGQDGNPVPGIVFKSSPEALSCPNGGTTVFFALDTNLNGVFDADDQQSQSATICNGRDGEIITQGPPSGAEFSCRVKLATSSTWKGGYVVKVTVVYSGPERSGWKAEFDLPNDQQIVNIWNASLWTVKSHIVAGSSPHNEALKEGTKITFGFQVKRSDDLFLNKEKFLFNGVVCK